MQETSKVRTTNISPAYLRSLAGDIPYSKEISEAIGGKNAFEQSWKDDKSRFYSMAPFMEFRYKSITAAIKKTGLTQVLEIAAGWSTRGMEMTDNPAMNYFETDQSAEEVLQKGKVTKNILGESRPNLHCMQLDILTGKGLPDVLKQLEKKPTCIVHEGLLRYMLHESKAKIIDNIKSVLKSTGGIYITPDIITSGSGDDFPALRQHFKNATQIQSKELGLDIENCFFKDQDEAQSFFERHGLIVERHRQGEFVKSSSAIKNLVRQDPQVEWNEIFNFVSNRPIWLMRLE